MALEGSFYNYPISGKNFGLYCTWRGVQNRSGNYTDITLNAYVSYYTMSVSAHEGSTISINGESETFTAPAIQDMNSTEWKRSLIKTKTVRVYHSSNGTKTNVNLSVSWTFNGTYSDVKIGTISAATTVNLTPISVYTLSTSAGTGSSITVKRTSSSAGATGTISNGAYLYNGDKLAISFTPSSNYKIDQHTVNGVSFTSGNTHTVAGNVSVVSTATPLVSTVKATNASVGGVSTITITRYSSRHTHSLAYVFNGTTKFITSSGDVSNERVKFTNTSVPFKIPTSFYSYLSNSPPEGKCEIACVTFDGDTQIGVHRCEFKVSVSETSSTKPLIQCSVVDTNPNTVLLTGNNSILIKGKSTAQCSFSATPQYSSKIAAMSINYVEVYSGSSSGTVSGITKTYANVSNTSFVFRAKDSRGFITTQTKNPTMVNYVPLTCNPTVSRVTPTGNTITISATGNFYRGSFGAYSNGLTAQYCYRGQNGAYCAWKTVPSTNITQKTASYTINKFTADGEFDYRQSYDFQIRIMDGAAGVVLSTVTKTVNVPVGIPVFDWGKNDFNINADLRLKNVNILDIIYPVGRLVIGGSNIKAPFPDQLFLPLELDWEWTLVGTVAANGASGTALNYFVWQRTR